MTGYTVHTGTSKQFVSGWDRVFGDRSAKKEASKASDSSAKKQSQKRRKS